MDEREASGEAQPVTPVAGRRRLSDQLADDLLAKILAENLRPGDRLSCERELGEEFGVSRTVVREAVRSLAGRGLVETRRGSGPIVAAVPMSAVMSSMRLYLRGSGGDVPYQKVHEIRVAIEVEVAGLAAERTRHVGVARLRDLQDDMKDLLERGENISAVDLAFHRALAQATGNEFFEVVLDSIVGLLLQVRETTLALPDAEMLAYLAHSTILDAVAARDVQGARAAMSRHLEQVMRLWEDTERLQDSALEAATELVATPADPARRL